MSADEDAAMVVEEFRQILLWPFALSRRSAKGEEPSAAVVNDLATHIIAHADGWTWCRDGLEHIEDDADRAKIDGADSPFAYQEFVYFHDFVARFLYGLQPAGGLASSGPMRAFHLFRKTGLKGVKVEIAGVNTGPVGLHVARCNLYLFRTGIAILALEVSSKDPRADDPAPNDMALAEVLKFSDLFRRLYTPYFMSVGASKDAASAAAGPPKAPTERVFQAQAVPGSVEWVFETESLGPFKPRALSDEIHLLDALRRKGGGHACDAPLADHWAALLPRDLSFASSASGDKSPFVARHILDERMAVLSYIRLRQLPGLSEGQTLERISKSDWMRLCFVDGPGEGYPYDETFLRGFDEKHAYDRFRNWGTRHLFSSYSYVMVCAGSLAQSTLVHHFRRMYFQMALIAFMEYATYIAISSQVSTAIEAADETSGGGIDGARFRETLFRIQREFLDFVHRFRFTGISNQVQAIEMYEQFRHHLRLGPIFEDVKAELETATNYLRAADSAEQSLSAEGLNVIAVIGATLGLAISLLSVLPNYKSWFGTSFDVGQSALTTIWTGLTFFCFSTGALALSRKATIRSYPTQRTRLSVKLITGVLVVVLVSAFFMTVLGLATYLTRR